MIRHLRYILILTASFFSLTGVCAESALQVLDKAVARLSKASSVNCAFKVSASGGNVDGSFKSTGRKFKLETLAGTTWFDGGRMWTSNVRSKEITLVNPSSEEIGEVNPFAYLDSYKTKYRMGFSKRKDNTRYLVVLNPRDKSDNLKAVEVAINKKSYLPERFIIRDRNDNVSTIYINSLSLQVSNPSNTFVCPVDRMTDYELVDLR